MIGIVRKYYLGITSIVLTILFLSYYWYTFSTNYAASTPSINQQFKRAEQKLNNAIRYRSEELINHEAEYLWEHHNDEAETDTYIHVYRNDSLIYWNTNQLPIMRFSDIHFPSSGLLHLQNGWYYAKTKEVGDYLLCASFLIKQDYSYKNKELINNFSTQFDVPYNATISLEQNKEFSIYSAENKFVCSIIPNGYQVPSRTASLVLMFLLLSTLGSWLFWLNDLKKKFSPVLSWSTVISIVGLRILSLQFSWFGFLHGTLGFDPSLYGTSQWFPSFFEYLLNIFIFIFVLNHLGSWIVSRLVSKWNKFLALALFVGSYLIWFFFLYLTKGLIDNSSISMVIDKLFSLDVFSILALGSLGVFFHAYFKFVRSTAEACEVQLLTGAQLAVICFAAGCLFFLYEINYGFHLFFAAVFPLVFYELVLYLVYRNKSTQSLGTSIVLLFIFSIVTAASIGEFNIRKEKSEREIFANQLITEKNVVTEIEYNAVETKLKSDHFLKRFIASPRFISVADFQEGIERRVFNGYWERYELEFNLFDDKNKPLIDKREDNQSKYIELEQILQSSGVQSDINPNVYFINDYTKQFNYIIRQQLYGKDSTLATLYCTLKSKKIPEEIGFPRLLISSKANVLESLESYSIARYHKGRLVTKYGEFNYPSFDDVLIPSRIQSKGFFDYEDFNHFALLKRNEDVVVLSSKNATLIDKITSFSYLFSLYGLMLLPIFFRSNGRKGFSNALSLAMKIQVVLISLVFLSLLAFGWGSGLFVSAQYNQFTNDVIREKLNSVETEVKAKLGDFESLTIVENGNYMQFILQKFAKVFFTDINMYDAEGYLLATSRPKVFNVGLLSEQMNPTAMKNLKFSKQSEFIHTENIGELGYSSAYKPFYNNKGAFLGFINLQHFGQQREFENQIQKFLVAIINVFILLLAISIILAIFISNWVTSPLRLLQESFASVKFGKQNEQILYNKEDEIGSLVQDYNRKLEELEYSAQQLAKNERELAWREMAKQVAHEIKNPLTPMKLSVQQLLRTYDPNDPKSGDKLKRVANSIVEQIEALTKIANEFSHFAKMPNPSEEKLEMIGLIRGVKQVFEHDDQVSISLNTSQAKIFVLADKDQFVRVFNNLIKNAIQAIPESREGVIDISLTCLNDEVIIKITDNGVGIEKEKQAKIFVPYFTTKSTGTGLGLAMVKQIIENHRGQIDFETKEGEGTTFIITLPIERLKEDEIEDK